MVIAGPTTLQKEISGFLEMIKVNPPD